uniref:Protein kinase domain-containing protein n=1 Tax=Kalanchoe fedtschenkoi TaxID=63787 RepID=A0A7N0RJ77_KALFE
MSRRTMLFIFLLVCIFASVSTTNAVTDPADTSALNEMYTYLNTPGQLTKWVASGGDPCGESWLGVTCVGTRLTEINLAGLGLSGAIGYQLTSLTSLLRFDVSNNYLSNQLPYQLPPNVTYLNLAGNSFNGNLPYSISGMTSLQYLNVSHNQLQNQLPDMFQKLAALTTLDLSSNLLSGNLPTSFSSLTSMKSMYLQNNQLTGVIDVLANLPLEDLNIENNHFTGWIPERLNSINLQKDGNKFDSGPAPPPPPGTPPLSPIAPSGDRRDPGGNDTPSSGSGTGGGRNAGSSGGGGSKSGIGVGIAVVVVSVLLIGAIVVFFLLKRKRSKRSSADIEKPDKLSFNPVPTKDVLEIKTVQTSSAPDAKNYEFPTIINLKPPPSERSKSRSFSEEDFTNKQIFIKKVNASTTDLPSYSIADLQMATSSFDIENLINEGCFGRVYRAQFEDGKVLAVMKMNSMIFSDSEDFIGLVSNISQLRHPNITELVGYCSEHGQHLLVYDFQKNGSLHDLLHLSDEESRPLTWNTRVKIALGSACALEYLHEKCSPSVIHKNFTSANLLLGSELNPQLADCGLASSISKADQVLNQDREPGCCAPEILMSGQYTVKSDVYSFGVVMLELLTGRKPFDSSKLRAEQSLVRWATPQLHDIDALTKMVDPTLKGLFPVKSLSRFADVIALCVQPEPEFRPPMSEVVESLVRLLERANLSRRTVVNGQGASQPSDSPDTYDYM